MQAMLVDAEEASLDRFLYWKECWTGVRRPGIPKVGKGGWDELRDWDWHVYTIDTV